MKRQSRMSCRGVLAVIDGFPGLLLFRGLVAPRMQLFMSAFLTVAGVYSRQFGAVSPS